MNLPNGHPEIFATSTDGYLFVRRSSLLGWTSWLLFPAPTREAFVTDVATLGGAFPAVYIIADGQVYARGKVGPDGYSNYGPWLDLPMNQARFIGASISLGGARQVFAVTAAGELQVASQVSDDAQSAFGAWSHLETLSAEVADLDVIPEADETLLYVLDASGSVRLGTYSNGGLTWQQIRSESDMPKFVAVAALARPSLSRVVVAVSASGQLYQLEDNLSWTTGDTR